MLIQQKFVGHVAAAELGQLSLAARLLIAFPQGLRGDGQIHALIRKRLVQILQALLQQTQEGDRIESQFLKFHLLLVKDVNRAAQHFDCTVEVAASMVVKGYGDLDQPYPDGLAFICGCAFPIFFQDLMTFKIIPLGMKLDQIFQIGFRIHSNHLTAWFSTVVLYTIIKDRPLKSRCEEEMTRDELLKVLENNQMTEVIELIEDAEKGDLEELELAESLGLLLDPDLNREVLQLLESLGVTIIYVQDDEEDETDEDDREDS